jgi:N-acetylglucosamine-6-phosphate deacetylase
MTFRGFVDLHTHGIGRYDTRTDDPSHIIKIAELHFLAGTAAILPTIYSGTIPGMRKNMEAVQRAMEMQYARKTDSTEAAESSQSRSRPEARILGLHLEGPFLNPLRCGGLDKGTFVRPTLLSLRKLIDGYADIIKIITVAPELPGALKVIERCRSLGIRVNMGHSDATYKEALKGKQAGATGVTHLFNAMRPFHHREPGLAGLGLIDEDLFVEVIADRFHLHPTTCELIFGRKRLDRIILVSDSVKHAGKKGFSAYKEAIITGSGVTLADSFEILLELGVPDAEILEAAKDNPLRYLRAFSL